MLLLSLLLPSLIISLPQSISKLSHLPSGIKYAVRHFRGSPTLPGNSASPVEGIPDLNPDPSDGNIVIEPLKPTYQPLIYTGKDAWRTFLEDPVGSWEKGDRDHVWFFWFSGVDVIEEGEIAAPLVEETEWPAVPGDEEGEFELRRRKLEVGMFQGSHNDEVYRDTAIAIAKQQQQTEWEQEKEARLSASSASKHTEPTSVDQIIFSSDTPTVTPSSYAHFAFVNCNDEEEKQLCYRFLAIKEHRPMLYAIVRNTTIIEPKSVSSTNAEPEVAPLVPEFVHMGEDDSGLKKQSSADSVINVEIEEKDISEDPIVEEVVETELPSPPEPTIIYKLLLRKVPLKENLTITDLHNFYEFKRWEKLPVWDDPLNPADGFVGTAMEGKVGEFIGMGYEYWYKMPKWVLGMSLGLLLRWITVTILDRSQQKRERKKALRAEKKLAEAAAAAAARVASPPQTPLKTPAIPPNVPKTPEIPVETQAPEEIEVVEHAELAKAEGVASIADVLGKGLSSEKTETKSSVESGGDKPVLEADEGETVVEAIEDVPIVETSEDEPAAETNGGKPIGFTNDDRSPASPNDDKPAVHTHDDGPVVYANDDKPVVHTNDDMPVVHSDDDDNDNEGDNEGDNDGDNDENDDNDDENENNNNDGESGDDEEEGDDENQDRPVIYTNGDSPVDHTNGDNLADSMTEENFDIIDPLKESIMETKDRKPVIEAKEGPGIEANDDEPVMGVEGENLAVDMREDEPIGGANEDEPVDRANEDEPVDRANEDEPVDRANEDEPVDRTNEDEPVDRSDEDELVDRSDEDELVDRTPEVKPDVSLSPVKPASKTPDTSPAKSAVRTPGTSPLKSVSKTPDASPAKPVLRTPGTSPLKSVSKTPDTSPAKPVLRTPGTSPLKPVAKTPDTSPLKPVLRTPGTSPLKSAVKTPDTSPMKPVVRTPEAKLAEEQEQSRDDMNSMEGL